jgi:hypothetical protein
VAFSLKHNAKKIKVEKLYSDFDEKVVESHSVDSFRRHQTYLTEVKSKIRS